MPFAIREDVRVYWKLDGAPDLPVLVLLNSIGTDMALWETSVPHLLPALRLLRIDTRGHGASDAPDGDYSLAMLADDVAAVMDAAGVQSAAVAGVSLGGMIAMELALTHPTRVTALALVCTSATMDADTWRNRIEVVRTRGTAAIADMAMGRLLSPRFVATHGGAAESVRRGLIAMADAGYAGCGAAIRDMAVIDRLPEIGMPMLVVAGDRDTSTPFAGHGERIVAAVPDAHVVHLDAAHLAPIETPAALAATLRAFLKPADTQDAASTLFEAGLVNRRRVLGDAWVDASLAKRTDFTADFQAMITRIAWNEIWGRPGLDDRSRRFIVLAITVALGRWEEFALHVRTGLMRDGFTREELKEVLMQSAIYAGVPAANTAFAEAGKIIAELDSSGNRG
ncbi:bifunctional 3-oxoadipate enol-lactonase/4-carboxymuconolactone decarboxylase PcaDC [Sphingomonas sp. CFBP 13706]|uniref:bifunctional 3-oxoadipate enol-lactonase/4-carboxymuconolactone decarboxylase PcaDC n=1 Tax=Sphingomonas sp. CFBP 13706 TaxID=2775314 RepID=UPI0017850550|nr:3-oxoadipate enol-lactonase [Sphingomonas sp. CFBP 13706]MBD8737212.1 3-oxoadipate enol-lactonase [Sphingomonas sp. CFBP 13706]